MSYVLRLRENELARQAAIEQAEDIFATNYLQIISEFKKEFGIDPDKKVTADDVRQTFHVASLVKDSTVALAALGVTFATLKSVTQAEDEQA